MHLYALFGWKRTIIKPHVSNIFPSNTKLRWCPSWNIQYVNTGTENLHEQVKNSPKRVPKNSLFTIRWELRWRDRSLAAEQDPSRGPARGQMCVGTGGWGCPVDLHGSDSHSRPHRLQRTGAWLLMICRERTDKWRTRSTGALQGRPTGRHFFSYQGFFAIMSSWLLLLERHLILRP